MSEAVPPVEFVAEVCSNHNRDLKRCLQLIDAVADIGADAVKFQLFRIREVFAAEIVNTSELHRKRENWELPAAFVPDIAKHCQNHGLRFGCTPFDLRSVETLLPWVDFYKIASYELLWDDLLLACGRTGKPVILSTGMATLDEVERAMLTLRRAGCKQLTLLHCVSSYPAPTNECNLQAIQTLATHFAQPVGWSDHSLNPSVIYRAVHRWGAKMVEFHFDLEGEGAEFSAGHCWLPSQIAPVIQGIKAGLAADGDGQKKPMPSELPDRPWRADPSDGLRPLRPERRRFTEGVPAEKTTPRVVAVIQARMGSTRFPGKVLKPLCGKPVLWHIVTRLRRCQNVEQVAIATSNRATDDPIADFAAAHQLEVVRGSETHVLERFVQAADVLRAEIVVRVTGDAPLVDPVTLDRMIGVLIEEDVEYCFGRTEGPCILEGFDPVRSQALRRLLRDHGDDPTAREHVTSFFKLHPDTATHAFFDIGSEYSIEGVRTSVDTPADLRFLEAVYQALSCAPGDADVREVVSLLRKQPELRSINQDVHQKGLQEQTRAIIFRVDGDHELGMGHLFRCLAIADAVRSECGFGVTFAIERSDVAAEIAMAHGFRVVRRRNRVDEATWLWDLVAAVQADVIFFDVKQTHLVPGDLQKIRETGVHCATIDDASERRHAVDWAFYPPTTAAPVFSKTPPAVHAGWDWLPLRTEFRAAMGASEALCHEGILVTMGGSDPCKLTLLAVDALDDAEQADPVRVIVGPSFSYTSELEVRIQQAERKFELLVQPDSMAQAMRSAKLALCSFGITAYELGALGVPALYLCLTPDHHKSALAFERAGMGQSLGLHQDLNPEAIRKAIDDLLAKPEQLHQMSTLGPKIIDGRGASRIANVIREGCETSNSGKEYV